MNRFFRKGSLPAAVSLALLGPAGVAQAAVNVQCPGDNDGDAVWNSPGESQPANVRCKHLVAGDSFVNMSDGNPIYTFGFGDQTGTPAADVIAAGILDPEWPGPTIELDEGDELYLSLTNVGTAMRPDLFDPHTVHFHGFPNAASVFDGVPEVSISINMGATLTYYYKVVQPGTFLYHCHVEATEHMEMGMLANLYVHPRQDATGYDMNGDGTIDAGELAATQGQRKGGGPGNPGGYAYNDGDGTTAWDVEKAIQVSDMDSNFHDQHIMVQPLPFAALEGDYPMLNGRGYPDTVNPMQFTPVDDAAGKISGTPCTVAHTDPNAATLCDPLNNGTPSQLLDSNIVLAAGQRLLLRLSNVSIDRFYTLTANGLPMRIVGTGASQMRGIDGKNLYRDVASVNFGGGEDHDVIIDTTGIAPGTYFLHATELHQMSNKTQMDGGMMTEIVVN